MKMIKSIPVLFFFTLLSSNLSGQEITVFPGFWSSEYYQDDEEIDKKELEALFAKNKEVQAYWKKAKGQATLSGVAVLAELGFAIWFYSEVFDESKPREDRAKSSIAPLIGTLGTATLAAIFLNASNKSKRKAILTYNKQFDKKTTYNLVPISNQNGLGLALKF